MKVNLDLGINPLRDMSSSLIQLNSYLDYYSEGNLVPVGMTVGEAIEDERKL